MAYGAVAPLDEDEIPNADLNEKDRITRQEAAVALRVAGANYSEIARTLNYSSPTTARQAIERALSRSVGDEDKAQQRFIQRRRLERLLRSVMPTATTETIEVTGTDGKTMEVVNEQHLPYVRAALALIDRMIRLDGLDAPQEISIYNPTNREVEQWVQAMVAHRNSDLPAEYDVIEGVTLDDEPIGDGE